MTDRTTDVLEAEHQIVFGDPHTYASHPHVVRMQGGKLVAVFNQSIRRAWLHHPPSDPLFRNVIIRSSDGQQWSEPEIAPGYDWSGVECAGLTPIGDEVLLHQWRFRWYPIGEGERRQASGEHIDMPESLPAYRAGARHMTWARGIDGTYVHRSADLGRTWTTERISTTPFSGGYGIRGAATTTAGTLVLPLSDIPNWRVIFTVRSDDAGKSWSRPTLAAETDGRMFEEPALLEIAPGRMLMVIRENVTDRLHAIHSDDQGESWSQPVDTGIIGCPPHLLRLADGRVMCTYGYRHEPYQIRAVISADGGTSWGAPIVIRSSMAVDDIGYPATVVLDDGRLLTMYYGPTDDGSTGIMATTYRLLG